ncbi:MAG TPA: response regulator [Terracidiphilus sp.]|nr:response regulator [Terracidiphilus sp.]
MAEFPRPPSILVVDDEVVIADTLTMILNMNGASACAAYSGEKALEVAQQLKPDILISDILMNGMSGVDLAVHLSSEFPACRLILISGQSATSELPAQTREQGYRFEFLEKPITPQRLLSHLGLTAPGREKQESRQP